MNKIPIIDEKDLNSLIVQALNGNGVLATPKEYSQMITNILGISINSKPRKDGRWQGYVLEDGKKHYVYGVTKEDVARKIKGILRNGLPQKKKKSDKNGVPTTFNAFATYYFNNFRIKQVKENTFRADFYRYKNYLQPYFKEKPIKQITPLDCQKLLDSIKEQGKGKTADEIYSLMSIIFKMAIKHSIISNNPLDVILHIKHDKEHGSALTKDEELRLKSALQGNKHLQPIMLLLYTGLRPNELKSAKINGNFIIAENSKRKNRKVEYKKIPISKMLAPYIKDGLDVYNYEYMRKIFKNILPNHILYDLRRTFYSRCKECGLSEHAIKEFMGHSLGEIGNAYTSLSDTFLIQEMSKFYY